jgi:coenzyme F420-reducing hydrogenase delta subunit
MCTGRVDLSFVLRAFANGADGVIIGGCWPGECHYVTEGNYDALGNMYLCKKLLDHIGVKAERLRLEWIAASEGTRFAEVMTDFVAQVRELGPLGGTEGVEAARLQLKLKAVNQLVPYMKLVEREKLRVTTKTEQAYADFYNSDEATQLFDDLIADEVAISQILFLLREGQKSTSELSESLGLSPSEISKHMSRSSNRGLVRYDPARKSYALVRETDGPR